MNADTRRQNGFVPVHRGALLQSMSICVHLWFPQTDIDAALFSQFGQLLTNLRHRRTWSRDLEAQAERSVVSNIESHEEAAVILKRRCEDPRVVGGCPSLWRQFGRQRVGDYLQCRSNQCGECGLAGRQPGLDIPARFGVDLFRNDASDETRLREAKKEMACAPCGPRTGNQHISVEEDPQGRGL